MGTWSITSSGGTDLVSIDNTGKLTYQEHTEDRVYTISYSDDTCGTITKDITIKGCGGPYYLKTKFTFTLVAQFVANNPIYSTLNLTMGVRDTETGEKVSEASLGLPGGGCSCAGDCPGGKHNQWTFTYDVPSPLAKPLSAYTFVITPSVLIGRDYDGIKTAIPIRLRRAYTSV